MKATESGKIGRPRCFCEDAALEAAMRLFWEKGYAGTSISDLTEVMGINRPSLYATFGDKESLFRRAIERYAQGPGSYVKAALSEPTAHRVVETLLRGAAKLHGDPHNPRGCMFVQGALAGGEDAEAVKKALLELRKRGEAELQKRLRRARAEGDLPKDVDIGDLTRYLAVVMNGLGVQAANGASKAEIARVVELTLRTLPI